MKHLVKLYLYVSARKQSPVAYCGYVFCCMGLNLKIICTFVVTPNFLTGGCDVVVFVRARLGVTPLACCDRDGAVELIFFF